MDGAKAELRSRLNVLGRVIDVNTAACCETEPRQEQPEDCRVRLDNTFSTRDHDAVEPLKEWITCEPVGEGILLVATTNESQRIYGFLSPRRETPLW